MMKTSRTTLSHLSEYLLTLDNFLIVTHVRPDGDAIGSVFALHEALLILGKTADIYFSDALPDKYKFLINSNTYIEDSLPINKYSNIISLDCGNFDRLAISDKECYSNKNTISIDHHPDNSEYSNTNYTNSVSCATSEILLDIFTIRDSSWIINKKIANCLLMGILLDSGGLRFDNTTATVLRKVAELIDLGADYIPTIKSMYFTKPLKMMNLEADIILNELKMAFDNKFAYLYLSKELLKKHNVTAKDTEGLIDYYRTIDGLIIAATLVKHNNGFRVSMRSNYAEYPVSEIAKILSGGGHKLAAGCFIPADNFETAETILKNYVEKLLMK
ncbi:MAG TPA: bifunctional oligoribonuclease/PAP phosphatase NrnA [Victivallales bacterium]|nr:bifunctional oligoribonuclease/PAP phosphatase NrnA [Victivallales bacterium]